MAPVELVRPIWGLDRSQIVIASKFANRMDEGELNKGASRRYIIKAVEDRLKRLGTDFIDLYQQHISACEQYGLGLLPYFPLASGILTGKYHHGEPAPQESRLSAMGDRVAAAMSYSNFDVVEKLTAYAHEHGKTLLDLAISWLASKPVVSSVIAGATAPEQVAENASAAAWQLSDEEMNEVNTISQRK